MTQHTELIERLRSAAWAGPVPCQVCNEAADALEAQAREIAELKAQEAELCTLYGLAQAECKRLRKDAEELAFLGEDLLYWVDRAIGKGNANTDIEESYARYEAWQAARREAVAAMAMKGQP